MADISPALDMDSRIFFALRLIFRLSVAYSIVSNNEHTIFTHLQFLIFRRFHPYSRVFQQFHPYIQQNTQK